MIAQLKRVNVDIGQVSGNSREVIAAAFSPHTQTHTVNTHTGTHIDCSTYAHVYIREEYT